MKRRELLLGSLALSVPLPSPRTSSAQAQPPTQPSPEEIARLRAEFSRLNQTLRGALQALPEAQLPKNGLWLLVNVDTSATATTHPDSRQRDLALQKLRATFDVSSLEGVTKTFGRKRQRFDRIVTLVPETMTVLNADPKLGDSVPLGEILTQDPLAALLGTLSDPQFDALLSKGLNFGELTADQASLLQKALPSPLRAAPSDVKPGVLDYHIFEQGFPADQRKALQERAEKQTQLYQSQLRTITDREIRSGLRLKVFQTLDFTLDVPGQTGYGIGLQPDDQGWRGEKWVLENGGRKQFETQESKDLQRFLVSELPNQLKPSELPLESAALQRSVTLVDTKTVGDVVRQVAQASRLELFCDPRFAAQTVLLLGEPELSVPASAVVKALMLSLCGTWRRVGSGFVLTHHTQGRAQLRALQTQIVKRWEERAKGVGKGNTKRLKKRDWQKTLDFAPGDTAALPQNLRGKAKSPLTELPKDLQTKLRAALERAAQPPSASPEGSANGGFDASAQKVLTALTASTPVQTSAKLQVVIELPGMGHLALGEAIRPEFVEEPPAPNPKIPTVEPIPITETFRAVLAAASTPEQATALVEKVAALGFNALLLAADSHGAPYFTNGAHTKPLTAAVAAGKKHGVAVWAALDVFCWRRDRLSANPQPLPEGIREDRSLLGGTSSESIAAFIARSSFDMDWIADWYRRRFGNDAFVSPLDPAVGQTLTRLTAELAQVPSLAGIAFQHTGVAGYLEMSYSVSLDNLDFGYLPEVRLARLRTGNPDPIDEVLTQNRDLYLSIGQNYIGLTVHIPGFDGKPGLTPDSWQKFRATRAKALLAELYQATRRAAPELPLLMRERKFDFNFEPWTAADKLNEMQDTSADTDELGKKASERRVVVVGVTPTMQRDWRRLHDEIAQERRDSGRGKSRGIVLDLILNNPSADCLDVLTSIAPYLKTAI